MCSTTSQEPRRLEPNSLIAPTGEMVGGGDTATPSRLSSIDARPTAVSLFVMVTQKE